MSMRTRDSFRVKCSLNCFRGQSCRILTIICRVAVNSNTLRRALPIKSSDFTRSARLVFATSPAHQARRTALGSSRLRTPSYKVAPSQVDNTLARLCTSKGLRDRNTNLNPSTPQHIAQMIHVPFLTWQISYMAVLQTRPALIVRGANIQNADQSTFLDQQAQIRFYTIGTNL